MTEQDSNETTRICSHRLPITEETERDVIQILGDGTLGDFRESAEKARIHVLCSLNHPHTGNRALDCDIDNYLGAVRLRMNEPDNEEERIRYSSKRCEDA